MNHAPGWGYAVIYALQSLRHPLLDHLFSALSFVGEEEFYLVFTLILYWLINKRLGTRFALLFLFSAWSNALFKELAHAPRPSPTMVAVIGNPDGGGFPSGHAQNAIAAWGYLMVRVKSRWFRLFAALLLLGIGVSRIYLGVHFPGDVLGGWMLGAAILALYLIWEPQIEARLKRQPYWVPMLWGAAGAGLLVALSQTDAARNAASTLFGLCLGVPLERTFVRWSGVKTATWRVAVRFVLALIVAIAIWRGLKIVLPKTAAADFVRYALLGLWVTAGAPWVWVRCGLAERETPQEKGKSKK